MKRGDSKPLFGTVEIIGLGQIGSSLGKALIENRLARKVIGFTRSGATARAALKQRAAHAVFTDPEKMLLGGADLVVFAVPVGAISAWIKRIPAGMNGTLFMDVGSAKTEIMQTVRAARKPLNYVSGHPMAGTEKSGLAASDPSLFAGRPFILIDSRGTAPRMSALAVKLVKGLGAIPVWMESAAEHDLAMAALSHLPHLLAYSLVRLADRASKKNFAGKRGGEFLWKLAGPSFKDATRVASSNPDTAHDFLWGNRKNLAALVGEYAEILRGVESLLKRHGSGDFKKWLFGSRETREKHKRNFSGT